MKHIRRILLLFAACFTAVIAAFAQDASTQGTEFWVSFMTNGHKYHNNAPNNGNWILTEVLVSGKRDCTGTITNPQTGWSTNFVVRANDITRVEIPENVAYIDGTSEQVLNRGLQIISSDTVSVFCTNIAHLSFDASYVLPSQSLADDYIIQTYDQSDYSTSLSYVKENQTSAFLIVATEDGTTVDITPTAETYTGRPAGREFTIQLNKGQVYQVRSNKDTDQRDLSGTRVTARDCKRIAVFNGNTLTAIPANGSTFDHIFEQAMPIQAWGKRFVVTCSLDRESDFVKITSAADNNEIKKNGVTLATLNTNESYIFELRNTEKSCLLESSGRSAVYLYNTRGSNMQGDPSVVWIAPIEQRIDDITFSTFNNEYIDIETHYVNIIVNSEDVGTVTLDGQVIPASEFISVNGSNEYAFARKRISHNVHRLQSAHGFNAHVYGFGTAKGYAYLVGSKTADLTTKVDLNDILVNNGDTINHCHAEPLIFNAEINLLNYELRWDFGDGTSSTDNPTTHIYDDYGLYNASLIITTDEIGGCMFSTSDTSRYYIDARQHFEYDEAELCVGETYTGHGLNYVVTNDTILGLAIDDPEHPLCHDSLVIYITALPGFYAAYSDTLCWQGEPFTYNEHGFDLNIDHPDTYTEHVSVAIPGGCDSIIDLTLVVTERIVNPNTVVYNGCAESFTWNGVTYTENGDYEQVFTSSTGCDSIVNVSVFLSEIQEGGTDIVSGECTGYEWHGHFYDTPGFYIDTIPNSIGCDSIVHLDLSLTLPPDPTEILPMDTLNESPHWVISATEFDIHYYDFTIEDNNLGAEWDSVQWSFENIDTWELQPMGDNGTICRVIVLNRVEDTVWLHAKVFAPCLTKEIDRRYWLVCSFYDLEETAFQTQIDIAPNPSKGETNLIFGDINGTVSLKVYDMTGILVDQTELSVTPKSRLSYNFGNRPSGVYLMTFNYNGLTTVRKVIIM